MPTEQEKPTEPAETIELEKNYGAVACKGLLNAAQLARKSADERISKGYASQTGRCPDANGRS